jgi:hypothetical protein
VLRTFAPLPFLFAATAALAQPPQLTPAQRAHVQALGRALATCHGQQAQRLAHLALSIPQVTDRVLAACASREAPIRAEVTRVYGPNAPRAIAAQRAHYREAIGQMVAALRAH